jgi:DNA-binding NtrC family response regulator
MCGEIQILILDDEEDTCKLITHALAHKDFVIESLSDPARVKAWLETAHEHHHKYHLIILDYVLPGLEPEDVLAWLRDYQPDAIVIVITGYPSVDSAFELPAGTHLRLPDQAVPDQSTPASRLARSGEQRSAADV